MRDGFHGRAAYGQALGSAAKIPARVFRGERKDALKYALLTNIKNGLRPNEGDFDHAFKKAVVGEVVADTDIAGVIKYVGCSKRTAERLTEPARAEATRLRDAKILAARGAGKSTREVAKETGLNQTSIARITGGDASRQWRKRATPCRQRRKSRFPWSMVSGRQPRSIRRSRRPRRE